MSALLPSDCTLRTQTSLQLTCHGSYQRGTRAGELPQPILLHIQRPVTGGHGIHGSVAAITAAALLQALSSIMSSSSLAGEATSGGGPPELMMASGCSSGVVYGVSKSASYAAMILSQAGTWGHWMDSGTRVSIHAHAHTRQHADYPGARLQAHKARRRAQDCYQQKMPKLLVVEHAMAVHIGSNQPLLRLLHIHAHAEPEQQLLELLRRNPGLTSLQSCVSRAHSLLLPPSRRRRLYRRGASVCQPQGSGRGRDPRIRRPRVPAAAGRHPACPWPWAGLQGPTPTHPTATRGGSIDDEAQVLKRQHPTIAPAASFPRPQHLCLCCPGFGLIACSLPSIGSEHGALPIR